MSAEPEISSPPGGVERQWPGQWLWDPYEGSFSAAVLGLDTIFHDPRMEQIHHRVSDQGDPMMTYDQGGVVIIQDGGILGGIGVGGIILIWR